MSQRRLFSPDIVNSDAFLDMPVSTQCLYFHLGMHADDDGFVNPKKIMRMIGVAEDDLKLLIAKRFVIPFQSGVVVIKHWLIHNSIRKDRYNETKYTEEKSQLRIKENMAYTDSSNGKSLEEVFQIEKPKWIENRQRVMKESSLPYSFGYKIVQAFWGKNCPICNVEMRDQVMSKKCIPTIQHNIPIANGGKHELGNISVICHNCNVSLRDTESGELNSKEVIIMWETIGNQSATQVKLSKVKLSKVKGNTPSQIAKSFFAGEEEYVKHLSMFSKEKDKNTVEEEFKKFVLYWTEPNKSGTKVKWEQQPTFEVKRRLYTWLNRSQNYSKSNVRGLEV